MWGIWQTFLALGFRGPRYFSLSFSSVFSFCSLHRSANLTMNSCGCPDLISEPPIRLEQGLHNIFRLGGQLWSLLGFSLVVVGYETEGVPPSATRKPAALRTRATPAQPVHPCQHDTPSILQGPRFAASPACLRLRSFWRVPGPQCTHPCRLAKTYQTCTLAAEPLAARWKPPRWLWARSGALPRLQALTWSVSSAPHHLVSCRMKWFTAQLSRQPPGLRCSNVHLCSTFIPCHASHCLQDPDTLTASSRWLSCTAFLQHFAAHCIEELTSSTNSVPTCR